MKRFLVSAFIALSALFPGAHAQDLHLISSGAITKASLSPAAMTQRVESAALKYQPYAPVPRFGLFDLAYPKDKAEFDAMKGFGVVLVVVQTQVQAEVPAKRLFIRNAGDIKDLKLLASALSEAPPSSNIAKVLGPYRWEGLYLFPISAQTAGTELVLDYQINRSGFVLTKFQYSGVSLVPNANADVAFTTLPDDIIISALVKREYPGFIAPEAVPASPLK